MGHHDDFDKAFDNEFFRRAEDTMKKAPVKRMAFAAFALWAACALAGASISLFFIYMVFRMAKAVFGS